MVKLIATDMDGTLLDQNGNLPPDFYEVYGRLHAKGIRFVIASGRSYATLKKQFAPIKDELTFICDNGAYVVDRGKRVMLSVLPKSCVDDAVKLCARLNVKPLLCGVNGTHHTALSHTEAFEILKYYVNSELTDDLNTVRDDIFKIAVLDEHGAEQNCAPALFKKFDKDYMVQVSGQYWVDIMNKGITKGGALGDLQKQLGISKAETMAFGDYLNDLDLLQNAAYSYVMANAHPQIKAAARFAAPANTEYGVTRILREIIHAL